MDPNSLSKNNKFFGSFFFGGDKNMMASFTGFGGAMTGSPLDPPVSPRIAYNTLSAIQTFFVPALPVGTTSNIPLQPFFRPCLELLLPLSLRPPPDPSPATRQTALQSCTHDSYARLRALLTRHGIIAEPVG